MTVQNKFDAFISYSHKDCGKIAPILQKGIENIAKPWWKIGRYRTVYRDETNLAADHSLWGSIEKALSQSKFVILLASPKAATSKWIKKEIEWWLTHKNSESILIVLVEGEINWDDNDFNWETTTCLPLILQNAFKGEPLFVNLSKYNDSGNLDYNESVIKTAIVQIISRIIDKPPREIESQELHANRISRILRVSVIILLSVLLIATFWLYKNVDEERNRAESNLKNVQLLRMKEFIINAQIFKDAEGELGEKKAREMMDSVNNIIDKYSSDPVFLHESQKLKTDYNLIR